MYNFLKKYVFIIILIFAGLFLRVIYYQSYPFSFDQTQIFNSAQQILRGDLTLIGPRTGPAAMFTGPLIYYLTAVFMLVSTSPVIIVGLNLLILALTSLSLFLIIKRSLGYHLASWGVLVWSFSIFFIIQDRNFWNPSLTLFASALVFFPVLKKELSKLDLSLIFLGCFLGYQAHFSGLALPLLATTMTIVFHSYRSRISAIVVSILGTGSSLLPTLIFDWKHGWLNFHGLLDLSKQGGSSSLVKVLSELFLNLYISIENIGKVFLDKNQAMLIFCIGLCFVSLIIYLLKNKRLNDENAVLKKSLIWIFAVAVFYSFYKGAKPEYYFAIQFPAIIILYATVLHHLFTKKKQLLIGAILFVYAFLTVRAVFGQSTALSLGQLLKIKSYVNTVVSSNVADQQINKIVFDVPYGEDFGLQYMLNDTQLSSQGKTLHVAYPDAPQFSLIHKIGQVGVWVDPRTPDTTCVVEQTYVVCLPNSFSFYQATQASTVFPGSENYIILQENTQIASLNVLTDKLGDQYNELKKEYELSNQKSLWKNLQAITNNRYVSLVNNKIFVIEFAQDLPEIKTILSIIQIY